jgi:cytidylate kinase
VTPPRVVTVDGPAGSGKTTLGRRLALDLDLPFVDTGLFYRALTVAAIRAGVDQADPERIVALARRTEIHINTSPADTSWEVRVDGEDVGRLIRDPRHSLLLSALSQIPEVRRHLLPQQRQPAAHGAVAVGRDCGTVVFPAAPVKLYLQATAELRTARRDAQLRDGGSPVDPTVLDADIARRDLGDAPSMAPAPDATIIDTGGHDIDAMVEIALSRCAEAGLLPAGARPRAQA